MSETTDNTVHVITDAEAQAPEAVPSEPSKFKKFTEKVVAPIKKHPKIALAAGLGLALVAGAAFAGNDSSDEDSTEPLLELNPGSDGDVYVYVESPDTEIA